MKLGPGRPARLALLLTGLLLAGGALAPAAGVGSQAGASGATVTLTVSPSAIVADQAIELTAVVRAVDPRGVPSGAISFRLGSTPLIGCGAIRADPDGRQGTYHCRAVLGVQIARLQAVFLPARSSTVAAASSNVIRLAVPRAPTQLTVALAPDVVVGVPTTLSARLALAPHDSGAIPPKGTIELLDAGRPIAGCPASPAGQLRVTCTITYGRGAGHIITGRFRGDDQYLPSGTPALRQTAVLTDGQVTARLHWRFRFTPRTTRLLNLTATGVAPETTVSLACQGGGCPAGTERQAVPACSEPSACPSGGSISLGGALTHAILGPGAQLTVSMVHPGLVGKSYRFVTRRAAQPLVVIACLTPGSPLPGSGCLLSPGP